MNKPLLRLDFLSEFMNSMLDPLSPEEFCRTWVYKKSGICPGEYGYRKACCNLLSELTGYGYNTCNNWLSGTEPPRLACLYLRSIDILWRIGEFLPER